MRIFELNGKASFDEAVSATAEVLRSPGATAVVPTETVYGLVSRVTDEGARRIYALKRRDAGKKLGWFVGEWRELERRGVKLTKQVCAVAERFTPGPLTIIAPYEKGGGIGFRIPDHPFLAALLRELGEPLLQTSANLSGDPDSLSFASAISGPCKEADVGVDGGELPPGSLASTVVDLSGDVPRILRQGALKLDLRDIMGPGNL